MFLTREASGALHHVSWVTELRFTTCDTCQVLKFELADRSLSLERRLGVLKQYRSHLSSQYADRTAVWALQASSCDNQSQVLTISIDGMDQAKFSIPRDASLQTVASLASSVRPRLALHAAWAMGYCIRIAVAHETVQKDSSFVIELLAQTLEQVHNITQQRGEAMPQQCIIIASSLHQTW